MSPHNVQGSLSYYNEAFARKLSVDELLEGHEGCVNRVCWSQDGNFLASASDDRKVSFYGCFPTSAVRVQSELPSCCYA